MSNRSQNNDIRIHGSQTLSTDLPPSYSEVTGTSQFRDSSMAELMPTNLETNTTKIANTFYSVPSESCLKNDHNRTYNIGLDSKAQPSTEIWTTTTTRSSFSKGFNLLLDDEKTQKYNDKEDNYCTLDCCTFEEYFEAFLLYLTASHFILAFYNYIMTIMSMN